MGRDDIPERTEIENRTGFVQKISSNSCSVLVLQFQCIWLVKTGNNYQNVTS